MKQVILNRLLKGHVFTGRAETEGRVSPCLTPVGNMRVGRVRFFTTLRVHR